MDTWSCNPNLTSVMSVSVMSKRIPPYQMRNRRYAEYEKERWRTYLMFLDWKKMADERRKRAGPRIFGGPDPIYFRPE